MTDSKVKLRVRVCAILILIGIPFSVNCTVTHWCMCGHWAHPAEIQWYDYANDLLWGICFIAAFVFGLRIPFKTKNKIALGLLYWVIFIPCLFPANWIVMLFFAVLSIISLIQPTRYLKDEKSVRNAKMTSYHTHETDSHLREEELQWADLLRSGNARAGMALVYIQKLCTAFHEIGPAIDAGVVIDSPESLVFLKERLLARLEKVLRLLEDNELGNIPGVDALKDIGRQVQLATSLNVLAEMTKPVHQINHTLVDALCA